jgi:hypothetical protein
MINVCPLFDQQEAVPAGLKLTVAPFAHRLADVGAPAAHDPDFGNPSVAADEINKLNIKRGEDWTLGEQAIDVQALKELEASLQQKTEDEKGVMVEELPTLLQGFEVLDAVYVPKFEGYSTRTAAFALSQLSLMMPSLKGPKLYLDFERDLINKFPGFSYDNSKEVADVSEKFDTLRDVGAELLEMRALLRQKRLQTGIMAMRQVEPASPDIEYVVSVIDNKGRMWIDRCKLDTVLTTSKGRVDGFRLGLVLSGAHPVTAIEPKPIELHNVNLLIQQIMPEQLRAD